jgi:hypothetical protein
MQYPGSSRCGACDAPAVFRFALCAPDERPADALTRRGRLRCPACFPVGKADYVAAQPVDSYDWLLVVDPAYTRAVVEPLCDCGLPADHRSPLSGEPRPCADETARIAIPGRSSRPPVRAHVAPVVVMRGGIAVPGHVAELIDPEGQLRDHPTSPLSVTGDETGPIVPDGYDSCGCSWPQIDGLVPTDCAVHGARR